MCFGLIIGIFATSRTNAENDVVDDDAIASVLS